MAFTNITVTGTFEGSNGAPLNGHVTATLSTAIQNGTTTIAPLRVVGKVENGHLSMVLLANNDPETLPSGSYYTFRVELQGTSAYEFKAVVDHASPEAKVDITKLYESSGFVGVGSKLRPQISVSPTIQEVAEVLVILGLAEQVQKPFARDL